MCAAAVLTTIVDTASAAEASNVQLLTWAGCAGGKYQRSGSATVRHGSGGSAGAGAPLQPHLEAGCWSVTDLRSGSSHALLLMTGRSPASGLQDGDGGAGDQGGVHQQAQHAEGAAGGGAAAQPEGRHAGCAAGEGRGSCAAAYGQPAETLVTNMRRASACSTNTKRQLWQL